MKDIAQALKFVRGAVGSKDFIAELTFFKIKDKKVMAFNGRLSLCHPIDIDFDAAPKAKLFEKALLALPDGEPASLTLTQTGRLSVKAGNFRAQVNCHMDIDEGFFPQPEGELHEINLGLLEIFKDVYAFTAEDASRPWAQSVRFEGNSAFATNNNVLIQRWCAVKFPSPIIISKEAVKEILRVGVEPCGLQIGPASATFHFPNGAWLRTQFLTDDWPNLEPVINQPLTGLQPAPPNFYADLKRLEDFVDDSGDLFVLDDVISTTMVDTEGANIEVAQPLGKCAMHVQIMLKIASVAEKIDFRNQPAVFTAPRMRGVAMTKPLPGGPR